MNIVKKVMSMLLTITLLLPLCPTSAIAANEFLYETIDYNDFWDGVTKTAVEPVGNEYVIEYAAQLAWIAEAVNSGKITGEGYTIVLNANLNFDGYDWTPIGTPSHPFCGSFDGKNYYIGELQSDGIVKDRKDIVGGIFGVIKAPSNGNCNIINVNIDKCSINVSGVTSTSKIRAGCIVGEIQMGDNAEVSIENINISGSAEAGANASVGGIAGKILSSDSSHIYISNINSYANVYANCGILSHAVAGGLIGEIATSEGTIPPDVEIKQCKVSAAIKGSTSYGNASADVGGLLGYVDVGDININQCMVEGSIYASSDTATAAGIVGAVYFNSMVLSNSFVTSNFTVIDDITNACMGGLIGICTCRANVMESSIENCYVNSSADSEFKAGFIVRNSSNSQCINILNTYFNYEKLGINPDQKVRNLGFLEDNWVNTENISTSYGLDNTEIKERDNFVNWAFGDIWAMDTQGSPLLICFDDGHDTEIIVETLVDRVKKYCSDYKQEEIDAIINGEGSDIEKANALLELLNQIDSSKGESQAFTSLTSNELYASYLMMDRLRSTVDGNITRVIIGLNGLIYGEAIDHITGDDPAYRKYKTLLSSFMKDSREEFELYSYIASASDFLAGVSDRLVAEGYLDDLLPSVIIDVNQASSIIDAQNSINRLQGKYTISSSDLKLASYSDLFSAFGDVATFADITSDTIVELSSLAANVECYHQYQDFLHVIESDVTLPSQLRAAARDLSKSYEEQYAQVQRQYVQEISQWAFEHEINLAVNVVIDNALSASLQKAISGIIPGIDWGIALTNAVLNMSSFVDATTYVEGYGMLQELYTKRLLIDKNIFIDSPTEQNAQQFYRDYTLLWSLRDKGEKMFLQYMGYDGTWSGAARQMLTKWVKYEELRQVTNTSRNYLNQSAFTFHDVVTVTTEALSPFDMRVVIDCPVDLYVYDSSGKTLLGKIEDGNVVKVDENSLLGLWTDGEQKVAYMPSESDYMLKVEATDAGTMHYYVTVTGDTDAAFSCAFMNVPLSVGTQFYNVPSDDYQTLRVEKAESATILNPTEVVSYNENDPDDYVVVDVFTEGDGTIYGSGRYQKGDYVLLKAEEDDHIKFKGWYENGNLISSNSVFGLTVYSNRLIEAMFDIGEESPKLYNITVDESIENGSIQVNVAKAEAGQTIHVLVSPNSGMELVENSLVYYEIGKPETVAIIGESAFLMPEYDIVISAKFEESVDYNGSSSSGNSGSGNSVYTIGIPASLSGGSISVSPFRASRGNTVTITADPDEGFELDTLTVTDKDGDKISVTNKGNGKYTFIMPSGKVTIDATFTEVAETSNQIGSFTDVHTEDWFAEAVQCMLDKEMMNGVTDTMFGPSTTTTRGMIVTILYRLEGEPDAAKSSFTDVAANMYYADAVAWAQANSIVTGITETTFAPDQSITREQMAAILYRYTQYKGYVVSGFSALDAYTDAAQISPYAVKAIQWANAAGLITGNTSTTINPKGTATRAEVATILMRFFESIAE